MVTKQLASLSRLTDSLSRATTLEEVYDGALDTLQSALGVTRADGRIGPTARRTGRGVGNDDRSTRHCGAPV